MAESDNMIAQLARSGRMRIAAALVVVALVGGGLGVIMLRGDTGGKALLFSGLDLEEAADIAGKLDTANVRYWLEGGGSAIFVPRDSVDEARMMISEQGLPTRGSVGWEIFDRSDALGATSFVQNINRTRALEGELARSIASLDMVKAARVHLALPDRPLFQRDSQQPTASVLLQLTGSTVTPEKVRAIQNLVASSVPGLTVAHVTVTDDQGRMLAAGASGGEDGMSGAGADERKQALEQNLRGKVLEIVENVAGAGAAKVTVAMDVDFNRVTQTSEIFNPDGRVLRSSSTTENQSLSSDPAPGDETTVANNVPTGAAPPQGAAPRSEDNTSSTSETVNYEISKDVRTEVIDGGKVTRLSVAVVVDNQRVPGAEGAPSTYEPRSPEELARILTLVKSSVGFDESRGDVVTVENLPFARPDISMDGATAPGPFDFDKFDIVRAAEIAALLVTALMLVLFVLRPLVKGLMTQRNGGAQDAVDGPDSMARALGGPAGGGASGPATVGINDGKSVGFDLPTPDRLDAGIDVARIHGQVKASSIKKISEVVSTHPDASLAIIRSWIAEEAKERAA